MRLKKKDKRFLAITIPLCTVLVALLACGGYYLYSHANEFRLNAAEEALSENNFERAEELAQDLDDEDANRVLLTVGYERAAALYDAGDYEGARDAFAALGDFSDSETRRLQCVYELAALAYDKGEYAEAADLFLSISGYEDALSRRDACRYALAAQYESNSELEEAFEGFLTLGGYEDALERATGLAILITGESNPELALAMAQGYEVGQAELMNETRGKLCMERLAAGFYHSLFVTDDGTVKAAGDNSHGQCGVTAWSNITAVAAGAYHSLGLCADGTVVAVGDNSHGQCSVSSWTDVVMIAAGYHDSYALTKDGVLLHTGFSDFKSASGWTNISEIKALGIVVCALRTDGGMLCSLRSAEISGMTQLCCATAGAGWVAGLKADGTAVSPNFDLSSWTNVAALAASSNLLVGVRSDGTLCTYPIGQGGQALAQALLELQGVRAVALSGVHAIVMLEDGSVVGFGSNDFGQLNLN